MNSVGYDPQEKRTIKKGNKMSNLKRTIIAITAALTATTVTVGATVGPAQAGTVQVATSARA